MSQNGFCWKSSNVSQTDIDSLKARTWLTDGIIGFLYEYFQFNIFKGVDVKFVNAGSSQYFANEDDMEDLKDALEYAPDGYSPIINSKLRMIFFPINNSTNFSGTGG